MTVLRNSSLAFECDPDAAAWRLGPAGRPWPSWEGSRFGLQVRSASGRRWVWDGLQSEAVGRHGFLAESPHGPLQTYTLTIRPRVPAWLGALEVAAEFALPADRPFLLWRLHIRNVGEQTVTLHSADLAVVGSALGVEALRRRGQPASRLQLGPAAGQLAFFTHGYQSWSFSGSLSAGTRLPGSRFTWLEGTKFLNLRNPLVSGLGHFTSDMFAVLGDSAHHTGLVVGFLSQREQFGHVEARLLSPLTPLLKLSAHGDEVPILPGAARPTDWAYLEFIDTRAPDPLAEYTAAVARANAARTPARTPVGWCSWYQYFDRVSAGDVASNLEAIAARREHLPLDLVQIDDGFQEQVGDWFATKPTFPKGLAPLAAAIRGQGCTPGLWLAPYIVRSDARLNAARPGWFLRGPHGRRVTAGFNWLRWCFALDPTHPDVRAHVRELIETAVRDWGFPYLKLDFLYAAALPGRRHDPSLTRAQAMRLALEDIRAAAGPETFLLGCGCPMGPAVGVVDGMRISTDVAPSWHPELATPALKRWVRGELGFVSARNAVHNIISRAPFHRRWWLNDPDCLLVRDEATRLTEAEVRCLATVIGLSGGMVMISDDLTRLKPHRARYLSTLLPVLETAEPLHVPGWLGERTPALLTRTLDGPAGPWRLAAIFNWDDQPRTRALQAADLGLSPGTWWAADFWEGRVRRWEASEPLQFPDMPPHGAHLLALRPAGPGPALVSSSFHFSQGGEIESWAADDAGLEFSIRLGRVAAGTVQLALPRPPRAAEVDGQLTAWSEAAEGRYELALTVEGSAQVRIAW